MPCSGCGQSGHNIRTCGGGSSYNPVSSGYSSNAYGGYGRGSGESSYISSSSGYNLRSYDYDAYDTRSVQSSTRSSSSGSRTQSCSGCGQSGHNIRTCGYAKSYERKPEPAPTVSRSYTVEVPSTRSERTCSRCHSTGHDIRTCQLDSNISNRDVGRVQACSGCGKSGHNVRTCPKVSLSISNSKEDYTPSTAIRAASPQEQEKEAKHERCCSNCGKPGHNIRTCPKASSANDSNSHACSGCGRAGHNVRTCPKSQEQSFALAFESALQSMLQESGTQNERCCSKCGKSGHDIRTCTKVAPPSLERSCSGCGKSGHNILTCQKRSMSTLSSPREVAKSNKSISSVEKEEIKDEKLKLVPKVVLQKLDDGEASKPSNGKEDKGFQWKDELQRILNTNEKEDSSPQEKVVERPRNFKPNSYITDNDSVQKRFADGPTPEDGQGYIYMYKYVPKDRRDPKAEELKSLYKIGMSKNLPDRRVKAQARTNEENYCIVETVPVANRYLTESIIHNQLEKRNRPRDVEDGGTEWFQGDEGRLLEVIRDAKATVEAKYGGEVPEI